MTAIRDIVLATTAAIAAVCLTMGTPASAQTPQGKPPMTLVSFGGAFTKSQMLAFVRPYRKSSGRWVNVEDYDGGLDEIRDQVESLNVKWDLVSIELQDAVRACDEGLLEPLNHINLLPAPDGTPARQDFYDDALQGCAIGYNIWSTVIAYRPAGFPAAKPATLTDFFDLERFPGPRGLRRQPEVNLEWALIADGVLPEQVYQVLSTGEGLARAFAVLDRIKARIVWWTKGSEPPRLLSSGRATMSSAWNGRIFEAVRDRGADLAIIWDRQVWNMDAWGIPKGSENRAEALEFITFATDPRRLAEQANYIAYAPSRRSAAAWVSDDIKPHLPTAEGRAAGALRIDYGWWAENKPRIDAAFNAWLREELFVYDFGAVDGN
ncbi:MAG: extracellular solute-binding protein [Hyphomicrobiaceae bacterium]